MRKTFTLIAFGLLGLGVQAQLVRSEFPVVGNTQNYYRADSVNPGPAGAAQNWNFGSLGRLGPTSTNNYIVPSTHPQGSGFPGADLCFKPGNDDYEFYITNADSIVMIGEKSVANTRCTYSDPATLYKFPQAFNTPQIDSVEGQYPDGFISQVTRIGWYQTNFDGDGQLTTPYMTYPSVKRVEISAYLRDSSWLGGAIGEVFLARYEWYAQGETMPVMYIHHQEFSLNGGNPSVSYEVWYADPAAVATTEGAFANLEVYPNPTKGNAQLAYRLDIADRVEIEVVSILGERVRMITVGEQPAGKHQFDLGTEGLAKGMYLVRLSSSQGSVTRKLTIE